MSLKDVIRGMKAGVRILVATDRLQETMKIAREHEEGDAGAPSHASCGTCLGNGVVGAEGHQVACPTCTTYEPPPKKCLTCRGTGRVGTRGHQVDCPVCEASK